MAQNNLEELYEEYLQFALDLGRKGGDMIKAGQAKRFETFATVETKTTATDFLTETDLAVEAMIHKAISETYPQHKFVGEESHKGGEIELDDEWTWIIDPIDGQSKSRHSPYVGCSIGLTHKKIPVVGVICQPFLNELYWAKTGGGAFLNGIRLGARPQHLKDLSECSVCLQWGSGRKPEIMEPKYDNAKKLYAGREAGGKEVHAIRIIGSSTGALACLASGQIDVVQDALNQPWDVCAGMVIIQETGGFICGSKQNFLEGKKETVGEIMLGRRYCFIRAVAPSETETSVEIQRRIAIEMYETIEEWPRQ
ncbi:hypothetical protein FFLO_06821 [Filobasidium floriforme]|uniref:Inositol-1-monophosphatase n=1 Tax=Filobasidium floriforme TaxID=5210 RepID=A0A8K0JFH5_9TREE|nr:hypothetical protein FFLO_06821 [Filobasidium floriforme]